jgi:hypothetical protein
MSRESVLILLAVLVIVAPFAGLPLLWLQILYPILGALILIIAVSLRRRSVSPVLVESTQGLQL